MPSALEILAQAAQEPHGVKVTPADPNDTRRLALRLKYLIKREKMPLRVKQGDGEVLVTRLPNAQAG